MTRFNHLFQRLKRGIAFLLAVILTVQPFLGLDLGSISAFGAETQGSSSSFAYYDSSNLLKPGASFPFYGKNHNRVGLWPYGLTNVEGGRPAPGYCLEPNKSMRTGTGGTLVTYDLDLDGDNLPLGLTREEAEILWYALSSSGNFEGYQSNVGKVGQGHYILGQCATWAIMSGNWAGLDDFRNQMEVLMANLKSPVLAAQTRGALEQFFNQTNGAMEEGAVPPFASKYKSTAPVHEMTQNDDGTYTISLKYGEGFDWRQSTLVYDLPEGWSFTRKTDGVTFICTTGNPDIGLVKGHFEEGSGGAKYWVKPNTFKIWYPDGWTEGSAVEGKQAMITMAGEQQTWEVWLSFGKGNTHTETGDGSYEIPYTQYLHEETFKRDYKIELEKRCDETGKTLEDSAFEILERFDFSQLDGTNLEEEQFRKSVATSEGGFETLSVCQSEITTDGNGHFEHSDQKTYHYSKTYCGGHPEPVIEPAEVSDEASEEEQAEADEKNEQLEQDAWAAWQQCVDWCEQNCDFHSIDEGAARDDMEADRNQAWETFIRLKRIYTVREIQARKGYILHDLHNDDLPVEIVEFMSSQMEGDGEITGHYPGNKKEENGRNGADSAETLETPKVSLSLKERKLVQAAVESSETGSEKERMDLGQRNDAVAMEKRESGGTKSETEEMEPDETKRVETKSGEMESSGTIRDLEKVSQKEEKGEQQENHKKTGEAGENGEVQGESQSGTPNPGNEELEKGELDTTEPEGAEKAEEESIKEREPEITPTEAETEESGQVQPGSTDKGKDSQGTSRKEMEEPEWEDEEQDMELMNDLIPATDSNAREWFDFATPSNAVPSFFAVNRPMGISEDDDEDGGSSGGSWEWDGVQEESEVPHIDQSSYPSDYNGYSYVVKDHRTEGELHINKRDLELYEQDGEDSYGKSQADATLEGAVYGLYAAEDIIHPDGKTGKVFSAGELVSIAATDKNGDASFVVITEVSETSKDVPNLYSDNVEKNGNGWIGRPLLLGSYYVEEISRSEGYELSRTGKNLSESNRTGKPVVLAESGSAHTEGFFHRINEWEGNSYDFTVDYFNTKGFDVFLSGLPEGVTVYEVTEKESTKTEQVATGSIRVEKRDSAGNIIYQTAKGGEYKLDGDGNKIIKRDSQGDVVYSDKPFMETVTAVNRLNRYVSAIEREAPSDMALEESGAMNQDYILQEVSSALLNSGYKGGLTDGPWTLLKLSGQTNGERIEEILQYCVSDSFWDAYEVDEISQKGGSWHARIRYGYKGIGNRNAIYDKGTGCLVVRREYENGYYYVVYEADQYERDGYRFTVEKRELDREALAAGEIRLKAVYSPVYETYGEGEFILDSQGQKVPVMETVPQYTTQETLTFEEILTPVKVSFDRDKNHSVVHMDTSGENFGTENSKKTFRVVVDGEISRYREAAVNVSTRKEELDEGSYVKYAVLLYPGQYQAYEDSDTRVRPIVVLERVIKQAIKVTKDIALDSYEHNTYEIHRDPFTVLFGGYNGKQETKTLPGFYFKLYLRSDLEETGKLKEKEDGSYDYEGFFKENPIFASDLALEWDMEKYDVDEDMTTVHASRGGGSDDYWGQSRMLPYGVYVLVEQQPTAIPQKAYAIDSQKEVEIPFIPQVDKDGTVHDKVPDPEYLYDSELTPEQLMERYQIRFNEETHIIYAHNHDGDFEVFKYGLEPDSVRDCQNETVAEYYHYGSVSEDAGTKEGVYYETYYDRDGKITDYGVTLDGVETMTGKSTAVDRKFAKALIPWSVLDLRYGEVINDNGDIGNREPGYEGNGGFNFVSFSNTDFENELYSSRLRIEKLDSETGILYGLDDWGNRLCMVDSETGMAYVTDGNGAVIVWPLDENGDKIISQSVEVFVDENGKQTINTDLKPVVDENGLPVYYEDGGVTWLENEWVTPEQGAFEIARVKQGAYILEETAAPLADGYVQAVALGLIVRDTGALQSFTMEDDYTKLEVSKLDMTSREEIAGAKLTLYEAYRVYDDSDRGWHLEILRDMDGKEIMAETWVSEGVKPHWIDHIMPGDYILRETRVPTEAGYVTSEDVEVTILETGEVQGFVMEDDHTAVEVLKTDAVTGKAMDNEHRAELALYPAVLNEAGEPLYDESGKIRYDGEKAVYKWQTDDGSEVRKTAHSVTVPGGHSYTAYDYNVKRIPGTKQAVCYVTETGALRFEYLPVGKYVLVEEKAPVGYLLADPVYVPVLDVGSKERVQSFTMEDKPIRVLLSKVNVAGGKELAGDRVSVYRAKEDGGIPKEQMKDEAGNLLFVTDTEGNLLRDDKGELIPAMEYDEAYLVDRWISGADGRYTKKDLEEGRIPKGYEVGDLRPHELQNPVAGFYYFVEEQTPFGYVRAVELPFAIVDTMEVQRFELVDELVMGRIEIVKADEKKTEEKLEGARFKFTNLDTNVSVILITDEEGRAVSSEVPVGAVGEDGTVSLYRFSVQEVKAPEGYLLDTRVHTFQFNVNTDRYRRLTYEYQALDAPSKVIVSKKALTTKEELPGASLEVRKVTETSGEGGEIVKVEGDVVESWTSTAQPHEIEYLTPGEYVLIETRAPEGYLVAEKVYFTVKENMTVEEIPFVEMFDDDTKTEIVKADSESKEPLAGAKLQLISVVDGKVIREWVTDETGTMEFLGLPAGEYLVKELEAPEGYQLPKEPFKLTVIKDYRVQTFTLENNKIEVSVEKRDMETREFVAGAVLELWNEKGEKAAGWITGEKPEKILGLVPGKYVLKEVKAPEGYLILSKPQEIVVTNVPGVQTFVVVNQKLEVDVVKKDKESGKILAGAVMRLVRNSDQAVIREWVSGQVPEVFKGLAPGSYTLEERKAPEGYAVAKSLTFEVTETEAKKEVVMEDERIIVDFRKTDGVSGEPLEGAVLQLVEKAGTKDETVIREWVSGKEPERFVGIHGGTYVIREKRAPEGFVPMKDLVVEIREDQAVQTVIVRNQPIQAEIGKADGDSGKLLGGATLQLVRNRDGKVIREWVSREGQAEAFKGLERGRYTVRELKAPSGYRKMEPQEIEVKETEGVQEFVVKNYKIRHSGGGGGGDRPKPEREYMELYKVDGATGKRLAGATITVYKPDGSVYFEGVTGADGTVRFRKPESGSYVFKETKAPEGYYLNGNVYQFVVGTDGKVAGEDTVPDYKKTTVIISKEDVTTSEELPGAEIEITDKDGNKVFQGTSDENGKVYFEVPEPGEYSFREVVAPEGYELNETVFSFTVFEDGSILGDCTITDRKHYGRITASYETKRKGDGDVTVGELLHAPKTGDTSGLAGLFAVWLASVAGLVGMVVWRRKRKKGDDGTPPGGGGASGGLGRRWKEIGKKRNRGKDCGKHGNQAGERRNSGLGELAKKGMGNVGRPGEFIRRSGAFFMAVFLAAGAPVFTVKAASNTDGEVLENLYEEYQYVTENPDSDEAQKLFEKEIERDGTAYRLSEIRTEVVKEEQAGGGEETLEVTSSPFLKDVAEKYKPEETYEKDGVVYRLDGSWIEEMMIPAHEVPVTEEVVYEAVEALDKIPSRISVTVTDEGTGQEMEVVAAADRQVSGEERWEDTFSFMVTFHEYGLEGYWLGDKVFTLDGDVPDFTGYERELLALIEASDKDYQVDSVSWDGEAYEDGNGIRCRNAVAKGKKLVRDCTVTYVGCAVFPEEMGARYVSAYVKEGGSKTGTVQYTMKAVGVYVPKKGNGAALAAVIGITGVGAGAGTAGYVHYRKKRRLDAA